MLNIQYEANKFALHYGNQLQGINNLQFTWEDIVRSALTVGRKSLRNVVQYGAYSVYEMVYRTYIIYANLMQNQNNRLIKSPAYKNLDPSEKSAVSYFIGITTAKLLAEKLLNVPWIMHLDVYDDLLPKLLRGNSRPDLVGLNNRNQWTVIEAKGRTGLFKPSIMASAKNQTRNLRKIQGQFPNLRVGLVSYFYYNNLCIKIEDPSDYNKDAKDLDIDVSRFLKDYYHPIINLINNQEHYEMKIHNIEKRFITVHIREFDIEVGLEINLYENLINQSNSDLLVNSILSHSNKTNNNTECGYINRIDNYFNKNVSIGNDGVIISLGEQWSRENMLKKPHERKM